MNVSRFHNDVARAELDFCMDVMRQCADVHVYGSPGFAVEALLHWLDAYEAGLATLDDWKAAVRASIEARREAEGLLFERAHAFDPQWQMAKLCAQASIEREGEVQSR